MVFYTKVLARFATTSGLKLTVNVDVVPDGGVSKATLDEVRGALRELGMSEDLQVQGRAKKSGG
jgi:hypothetical protein